MGAEGEHGHGVGIQHRVVDHGHEGPVKEPLCAEPDPPDQHGGAAHQEAQFAQASQSIHLCGAPKQCLADCRQVCATSFQPAADLADFCKYFSRFLKMF